MSFGLQRASRRSSTRAASGSVSDRLFDTASIPLSVSGERRDTKSANDNAVERSIVYPCHDDQGVVDLGHVQARQIPPGTAYAIKRAAIQVLQQFRPVQLRINILPGSLNVGACFPQNPQRAQGQCNAIAQLAHRHIDEFQAAAAEITNDTVGIGNARQHPLGCKCRLLASCQHADINAQAAFSPAQ